MDESSSPARLEHRHRTAELPRHWIVIPPPVRDAANEHAVLRSLMPTHVGFFPRAGQHRVHRPHGTRQMIFNYCVEGAGYCELDGRRFEVRAGDLLVLPARRAHAYGSSSDEPWTVHWFHATGHHLPALLDELGVSGAKPVVYLGPSSRLTELFDELREVLEIGYSPPELLYASQLLAHVFGVMIRLRRASFRESPDAEQRALATVQAMQDNLDRPLSVEDLARSAHLSVSHYFALFRRLTGYSPRNYYTRLRIHRAAQLLTTTRLSVKVVARRLGYDDPLYFSRTFRLVNGVSPREYRELRRQGAPAP